LRQLFLFGDFGEKDRNMEEIDVRALRQLQVLYLESCPKVRTIRANDMPNLLYVDIRNHSSRVAIENLYVQGSSQIDSIGCVGGLLNRIDVSGVRNLRVLNVSDNKITRIDGLADCPDLKDLRCFVNQLTELNVKGNPRLERLQFHTNKITEIDLSENRNINYLSCAGNPITELNIGHLRNLSILIFNNTAVSEMDFSNMPQLRQVYCNNTAMKSIDLSANPNVLYLDCFSIPSLQTINISDCQQLTLLGLTDDALSTHNSFNTAEATLDLGPYGKSKSSFKEFIADGCPQFRGVVSTGNDIVERISLRESPNLRTVTLVDNANLRYLDVTDCDELRNYQVEGAHPDFEVVGRD
jgi:Leucine-rich repeat (LRR) protein